ncbi:hypothetical protein [Pseudomonas sp. MWU12-2345]|uniref:hypothetical protein n=1 Tax=Pseudomonas sp. MWU12-2345 TaxID=2928689 RepID=UPI0020106409|nr:hypothetical protein [Pseudomonas sp. MWU12-2345]
MGNNQIITRETLMTALRAITHDLETLANDSAIARHKSAAAELRALLAKQALCATHTGDSCKYCGGSGSAAAQPQGEPVACAHEWTDDGEFTLVCTKCGAQENHEPYGWVQTRGNAINAFTQEWDVVQEWDDQGFEYKAMFDRAEQPAPAVVIDDDWRMNPCKLGHRDVGAAGGVAHCYTCDEKITATTTQEAFEQWNATHPAAESR